MIKILKHDILNKHKYRVIGRFYIEDNRLKGLHSIQVYSVCRCECGSMYKVLEDSFMVGENKYKEVCQDFIQREIHNVENLTYKDLKKYHLLHS